MKDCLLACGCIKCNPPSNPEKMRFMIDDFSYVDSFKEHANLVAKDQKIRQNLCSECGEKRWPPKII